MEQFDLALTTLFGEFQEAVFRRVAMEREFWSRGTFVKKRVKGKEYWYEQRYQEKRAVQRYVGPSTPKRLALVEKERKDRRRKQELLREMIVLERGRTAVLARGGLPRLEAQTALLLERLSELIDTRGILIGSYAFAAYSGILGRLFERSSLRTQDIDIAREVSNLKGEEIRLGESFHAVPALSPKYPSCSFIGPHGLRVDFVTPLKGRPRGIIRMSDIPGAGAQPLRFLDYLIRRPVRGVLLGPKGGIAVTVPDPTRFAIHKLLVASRRSVTEGAKKGKDLLQASQLIEACSEERPEELAAAYREAIRRGKKWNAAIRRSLEQLPPHTQSALKEVL